MLDLEAKKSTNDACVSLSQPNGSSLWTCWVADPRKLNRGAETWRRDHSPLFFLMLRMCDFTMYSQCLSFQVDISISLIQLRSRSPLCFSLFSVLLNNFLTRHIALAMHSLVCVQMIKQSAVLALLLFSGETVGAIKILHVEQNTLSYRIF